MGPWNAGRTAVYDITFTGCLVLWLDVSMLDSFFLLRLMFSTRTDFTQHAVPFPFPKPTTPAPIRIYIAVACQLHAIVRFSKRVDGTSFVPPRAILQDVPPRVTLQDVPPRALLQVAPPRASCMWFLLVRFARGPLCKNALSLFQRVKK
ncbi:hypothetical protein BC938DRAFT_475156 [Jimgerdemannia flammicorona]|uniref:Uncharacterized protein n=1 Tax=Jimgerdemannia flammicorona TaxID=994334 RepID=A0A433PZM0_9FUNG|nr:hypothetical protein BC938DRAFT_475156 [Jimgerdemannia flammicorona]